jgi:hypothetical protein
MDDMDALSHFDLDTLVATIIDVELNEEVHRKAISVLLKCDPMERNPYLVRVMKAIASRPSVYDHESMMALVDILATDPDPEATEIMLECLPIVAESSLGKDSLSPEFRTYFYEALATRQREDDLDVWGQVLPTLSPKTLVALVIDSQAKPLEIIEPTTLLTRLIEPDRTKGLLSAILGLARRGGAPDQFKPLVQALKERHDEDQMNSGLSALEKQWEMANKAGRNQQVKILEAVLRSLDTRPRTAPERLMGRRPWAS